MKKVVLIFYVIICFSSHIFSKGCEDPTGCKKPDLDACANNADCKSNFCYKGICNGYIIGNKCEYSQDCFPELECENGTCCSTYLNVKCSKNTDCCSANNLVCEQNLCKRVRHGQCNSATDCAYEYPCTNGACCKPAGSECKDHLGECCTQCKDGTCCSGLNEACNKENLFCCGGFVCGSSGTCIKCVEAGQSCNKNIDCCSNTCEEGICRTKISSSCTKTSDCVAHSYCYKGICSCKEPSKDCTETRECCFGSVCVSWAGKKAQCIKTS